jgi:hypothetical protein
MACPPLAAQAAPGYAVSQLACARFRETTRTQLRLETAGTAAGATSGRDSEIILAATSMRSGPSLRVVAWFDSLVVWRSAGGSRLEPDASGVLGGRYRGELAPDGSFTTRVVPFVPDAVREVTDLATVLDDMLPRLPPVLLQVGEEWRSGDTLAIKRLSDSLALQRYRVQMAREGTVAPPPGDSLTPTYTRSLTDRGVAAWDPARGVVRYGHEVNVEASVPAGGAVKNAARSRVEQRVLLERLPDPPLDTCPAAIFAVE